MKTSIKILLSVSILLLSYFCIMSVYTPIRFEQIQTGREKAIIKRLTDIRKVELEFKEQKGRYTASFDTLISFLLDSKKKMVMKEGALSDKQLEAGLTEVKATKIVQSGNQQEIAANGLQNFRRDTAFVNMFEALFQTEYTQETINQLAIVPHSNNQKFELRVKNDYLNSTGIRIPLFEACASFESYLSDLDQQEMLNVKDIAEKLNKYPGLKVGSVEEPNNNAGNWE